uniref:RNA-directed RNA polymerase n=1 Tax=Phakopsora totivirus B TaxID=2592697 RepID=A0A7G3KHV2_9VIRU|nr:putative RdRp [Phakopsora totivirus B]
MLPCLERLAKVGMHEAMFVGLVTWARLLTPINKQLLAVSGIWDWEYTSIAEFSRKIKNNFSLRLKALQNLVDIDLEQFFEMEVLVNRGVGEVDWQAEEDHRVNPNTNRIADKLIFEESVKLFKKLKRRGSKPYKTSWSQFWDSRWGWAPTGAYHSQYEEDQQYKAKEPTLRSKLFAVARMPKRDLEYFCNREPQIVAWPSTKYEWGKQRAIYGVDFTNFVMTNFALYKCEELLEPVFPVGRAAREDIVSNRVQETLRNGIPYCFDFEDFNSQHTKSNMQSVLRAYALVFSSGLTHEQQRALNWVIESVGNGKVKADTHTYELNGTLLSGWRLTTFINTILNHVYITLLTKDRPMVSLHNGDDVLAGITSLNQVQNLQANAEKYNIRFQQSKCFLGSIAEFLRVDHNKGIGAQYLCRGVATFVHGPTESIIPNDIIALLQSLETRKTELEQRGGNTVVIQSLFQLQLARLARLWDITQDEIEVVRNTHLSKGGVSSEVSTSTLEHVVTRVQVRSVALEDDIEAQSLTFPGVWDYANHVMLKNNRQLI